MSNAHERFRSFLRAQGWWVAGALIVGAGWATYSGFASLRGPQPVAFDVKLYFLDEDTGQVIVGTERDVPPLVGKNGKASVVQAIYMTADDERGKTLVYLQKYTDKAKAVLDEQTRSKGRMDPWAAIAQTAELLVRKPEPGAPWVKATSPEGQVVINSFQAPPNARVRYCNP